MATASITVRLDPDIKARAQALFDRLGLDMSTAINLLLRKVVAERGFTVSLYELNQETVDAIREVKDKVESGERGTTWAEMRSELLREGEDDA